MILIMGSSGFLGLHITRSLEERGYEVAVSHATGMSGRIHERAIADGPIAVSLDLAAGIELLNSVTDGACSAGIYRLEAACRAGIPQIESPGAHRGLPLGSGQTLSGPLQRSTWAPA
jgi:uncharacterized protein (UPF0261 family)